MESVAWLRRRWWLVVVPLLFGVPALGRFRPQWYLDEAETLERVAALLDSPVPYERNGTGWLSVLHVSRVVLPAAELDEEKTRRLASLLRELPRDTVIVCHYVRGQAGSVELLRRELGGHAIVVDDPGASSQDIETRQERTHVAGIHRPELLRSGPARAKPAWARFDQRAKSRRFQWATNLPLDLFELDLLAQESWTRTYRWMHASGDEAPVPDPPLPIYLCANAGELEAIEKEFGLTGSSFQVRSNVGGFYRAGPLVAVIVGHGKAPEYAVHEVVHAVVERSLSDCPDPLNEGAAMLLTERILGEKAEYASWAREWTGHRRRFCRSIQDEPLSLEVLFSLDYMAFRETRDGRNYWLSLELVRVLDRENDAADRGALQRLFLALERRRGTDPLAVFGEVYSVPEVEALWRAQVRDTARGAPGR
jgi:hypothetical protein